jgi:hypothetical protein
MRQRLLAIVLFPWLTLSACEDVERCQVGTVGCYAGPPDQGSCKLGLVMIHGTCAEPGETAPPLSCGCHDGAVCTLDGYRCADYCAPLDVEIGTLEPPAPIVCDGTALSFEELCQNRCQIDCRQRADLCGDQAACDADYCESAEVLSACRADCGGDADPRLCMALACGTALARACDDLSCPNGDAPACDDVQCRNACPGYNFDGVCDDGDLKSAVSGVCLFGTDCADCGPRRGSSPRLQPQGGVCAFHSGCAGANVDDIADARAWCIEVQPGISRCAPDCSSPGETCPAGSACFQLSGVDQDGDGAADPIQQGQLLASACFPNACQ